MSKNRDTNDKGSMYAYTSLATGKQNGNSKRTIGDVLIQGTDPISAGRVVQRTDIHVYLRPTWIVALNDFRDFTFDVELQLSVQYIILPSVTQIGHSVQEQQESEDAQSLRRPHLSEPWRPSLDQLGRALYVFDDYEQSKFPALL